MSTDPPYPFHVAAVAPRGFDHPDLAAAVASWLAALTVRVRRRERRPVSVYAVCGEPVCGAALAACRRFGWDHSMIAYDAGRPWRLAATRAHVELAAMCDAVVVFHAGELPADLARLLELCPWLGTPARRARVG